MHIRVSPTCCCCQESCFSITLSMCHFGYKRRRVSVWFTSIAIKMRKLKCNRNKSNLVRWRIHFISSVSNANYYKFQQFLWANEYFSSTPQSVESFHSVQQFQYFSFRCFFFALFILLNILKIRRWHKRMHFAYSLSNER